MGISFVSKAWLVELDLSSLINFKNSIARSWVIGIINSSLFLVLNLIECPLPISTSIKSLKGI